MRRLGFNTWWNGGLHEIIDASIWFECRNENGSPETWVCKAFPALPGKNGEGPAKFLTEKKFFGYPFIPSATWKVANSPNKPLVFTEGPVKALAVLQAGGYAIGVNGVWQTTDKDKETGSTALHPLIVNAFALSARAVYLAFDADFVTNPSVRHALIRATILFLKAGAEVKILTWPIAEGKGIDDYLFTKGGDLTLVLKSLYSSACELSGILRPCDLDHVRSELISAELADSKLNQICKMVSPGLDVRASTLEEECKPEATEGNKTLALQDPEAWPEAVDGCTLLDEIYSAITDYVVLKDAEATTIALWILLTYFQQHVDTLPILAVTSPEKRCGKTVLMTVLNRLSYRACPASSISPAALYRMVEKYSPTLLVDECDAFLKDNEELRGIINSGHQREFAYVHRCHPVTLEPIPFSTWCAKALAGIKSLPETITDRSLHIKLQRKSRSKSVKKLRTNKEHFKELCRQAFRWAQDNSDKIRNVEPVFMEALNDRASDNWEPLLAIASIAGASWADKAKKAALSLSSEIEDKNSWTTDLLQSLQRITQENKNARFFPTEALIEKLNSDKESPWYDWPQKLTEHKLGRALRTYGISATRTRIDGQQLRGYSLSDLSKVFESYLETPPSPFQTGPSGTSPANQGPDLFRGGPL